MGMKSIYFILALHAFCYPAIAQFGVLDSTFNGNGKVTTDFLPHGAIAKAGGLQSDGKIIAAGTVQSGSQAYFGVARYNSNGSLDTTFGIQGKAIIQIGTLKRDYVRALSIQSDDKIILAGTTQKDTNNHIALLR